MRWGFVISFSFLLAGCDSGTTNTTPTGGGSIYALSSTLQTNTMMTTSLLYTSKSLTDGSAVDYNQGIPIADTVSIFGIEGAGSFWSSAAMSANVTKYDVDANGKITPGATLDFSSFGLSGGYSTRSIIFASKTKAYLLDDTTLQAITFDPTAMTVGKAIDLTAMKQAGYVSNFSYVVPVRNGKQIVVAAYFYDQTYSMSIPKTLVALIDTTTDMATVVTDSRCGDISTVATAANGDLYFGSDTYAAALNRLSGDSVVPPGCLIRMKAGENTFDASFLVKIKDITGGMVGGGAVTGDGTHIWVRGYNETIAPVTMQTTALKILGAPAWQWFEVDLSKPTAMATKSAFAASGGELKYFTVAGHAYVDNPSADYTTTTMVDMTAGGAPQAAAVFHGTPAGIVKVR
jgi:hypothetical protein